MRPPRGCVLGVDLASSPPRRSSAVCRLDWTEASVTWTIRRFRAVTREQEEVLMAVAGGVFLYAADFDGTLRAGLDLIGRYRNAEGMLHRGVNLKIATP